MYGYIYKTINLVNGKIYIGQKKSDVFIDQYRGSGKLLLKAFKKYGKDNFYAELVCWCKDKKELDERERYWIKESNSRDPNIGYNLAEGGEGSNGGGFKGKHHSEESIKKHREAAIKENARRKALGWKSFNFDHHGRPPGNKGRKKIIKDHKIKYVTIADLDSYLSDGWQLFHGNKRQ